MDFSGGRFPVRLADSGTSDPRVETSALPLEFRARPARCRSLFSHANGCRRPQQLSDCLSEKPIVFQSLAIAAGTLPDNAHPFTHSRILFRSEMFSSHVPFIVSIIHLRPARLCLLLCFWLASTCAALAETAVETPVWFDEYGPLPAVYQALDVIASAADDGLEPRDYGLDRLRSWLDELAGTADSRKAKLKSDLASALSLAMTRFLRDLHDGRLEPRRLGMDYPRLSGGFNADNWLTQAVSENRLDRAAREAAPTHPYYPPLLAELTRYRGLLADPAWQSPLLSPPGGKLSPGQFYADLPRLHKRLQQLGDLPDATAVAKRYEGALIEGVKSFQERHALPVDGTLGSTTLQQLNVPPAMRVRQLILALERLRWTPLPENRRHLEVNIPEFMLRAHDFRDGTRLEVLKMRVIVGKVGKTATPRFYTEMRTVEFSPNWNVPPSIAKGETLPRLRRDPGYLQRAGMQLVAADGSIAEYSATSLDAVERGHLRLRQKPGRGNALGQIKFILPNTDGIYLHHTPTPQLFRRERRDFSHGCVRVEMPVDLAAFVLADQPAWTRQRIVQAMEKGRSSFVTLPEGLPVVISYETVVFRHGRLYFFPDIYEQDKILELALQKRALHSQAAVNRQSD